MSSTLSVALTVLLCVGLAVLVVRFGTSALRAAKRPVPGAGAVGWALLFLTSGRMPPPPPASQIELNMQGEKDRASSDPLQPPANNRLEPQRHE